MDLAFTVLGSVSQNIFRATGRNFQTGGRISGKNEGDKMKTELVLSLFPGIDLLGKGFESEGFCVVRGPDIITGGNIKDFHSIPGRFDGIIGGPPCQDFSGLNRKPTGKGMDLLREFIRVVVETQPKWFLMENVARVPDIEVPGYTIQRFDLNARECGLNQSRARDFQFGSRDGLVLVPERRKPAAGPVKKICLASEGKNKDRRDWGDFCELQGLPRNFKLEGWSISMKYRVVGNGVPVPMARVIARAIKEVHIRAIDVRLCQCGCGRICTGGQRMASPACRKRVERARKQKNKSTVIYRGVPCENATQPA